MNFEIKASLLIRLEALVAVLKVARLPLARQVFRAGLDSLEKSAGIGRVASLDKDVKKDIEANPKISHKELASRHHLAPVAVKACRRALAENYLETGPWQKETDGAVAARFGLHASDIFKLRLDRNLLRIRGNDCPNGGLPVMDYIAKLGGAKVIKETLTNGGKIMIEIFREAAIVNLSRERQRQIIGSIGLRSERENRTALWYANRLLGPGKEDLARQIANPKQLERMLALAGGVCALAGQLGVGAPGLKSFVRDRVGLANLSDPLLFKLHGEMVELVCDGPDCGITFFRSKYLVNSHPERLHFHCKACQGKYLGVHYGSARRVSQTEATTSAAP
ncbi:MAG: hypothetical protein HYV67_00680 [Candidatus Taylorbacteria bacterium]|nr:hypothetical protein [Candidatus Taylorbacteria bacterium]